MDNGVEEDEMGSRYQAEEEGMDNRLMTEEVDDHNNVSGGDVVVAAVEQRTMATTTRGVSELADGASLLLLLVVLAGRIDCQSSSPLAPTGVSRPRDQRPGCGWMSLNRRVV